MLSDEDDYSCYATTLKTSIKDAYNIEGLEQASFKDGDNISLIVFVLSKCSHR